MRARELRACSVGQNVAALRPQLHSRITRAFSAAITMSPPGPFLFHCGLLCDSEHRSLCYAVGPYLPPRLSPPRPAFKTLSRWKLRKGNRKGDSVEILCVFRFQSSCPSSSFCGTETLRLTQGPRVAITQRGPLPPAPSAATWGPPSRQGPTPPPQKGWQLSWTRTGTWTS